MTKDTTTDKQTLKDYLNRSFTTKRSKAIVQERQVRLQASGNASAELRDSADAQAQELDRIAGEIQSIIALLPAGTMERTILELRHIDCLSWREIRRKVNYTKTPCFTYYSRGLDKLVKKEEVRETLASYRVFSSGKNAAFTAEGG